MLDMKVSGPIATITLDDCPALSTHSEKAGLELRNAILSCGDRDDLKVIILRGDNQDFCAISDPKRPPADVASPSAWNDIYASSAGLYQALCFSKKVTITAVQGACAQAGSLLVLCSDLTVAVPDARFYSPFLQLPEANFVLAALTMRLNRAKAWMLDDVPLDATAALDAGLINRIAANDLMTEALEMASSAAKIPLDGIAMSKLMIETCLDSQGVGQDFDMAGFYSAAVPQTTTKAHL